MSKKRDELPEAESGSEVLSCLIGDESIKERGRSITIESPKPLSASQFAEASEALGNPSARIVSPDLLHLPPENEDLHEEIVKLTKLRILDGMETRYDRDLRTLQKKHAQLSVIGSNAQANVVPELETDKVYIQLEDKVENEMQARSMRFAIRAVEQTFDGVEDALKAGGVSEDVVAQVSEQLDSYLVLAVTDHLVSHVGNVGTTQKMRWPSEVEAASLFEYAFDIAGEKFQEKDPATHAKKESEQLVSKALALVYSLNNSSAGTDRPDAVETTFDERASDILRTMEGYTTNPDLIEAALSMEVGDLLTEEDSLDYVHFRWKHSSGVERNRDTAESIDSGKQFSVDKETYVDNLKRGFTAAELSKSTGTRTPEFINRFDAEVDRIVAQPNFENVLDHLQLMATKFNANQRGAERTEEVPGMVIKAEEVLRIDALLACKSAAINVDAKFPLLTTIPVNNCDRPVDFRDIDLCTRSPEAALAEGLETLRVLMNESYSNNDNLENPDFRNKISSVFIYTARALQACDVAGLETFPDFVNKGEKFAKKNARISVIVD